MMIETTLETCRRRLAVSALTAVLTIAAAPFASAQQVVAIVNGDPITSMDVEQRAKFIQLSTHKAAPRQEVLNELVNEILKVKEAKRFSITISDSEVESAYANMASRTGATAEQFNRMFAQAGINPATLKARLRADLAWGHLVRGRFQSSLQVGEKDILNALETRKKDDGVGYEYKLRPILFIVTKNSANTSVEARRREADALRGRFQSCEQGIPIARTLRDVAVRSTISRASADLPDQLRDVLEKTPVGRLTPPEVTRQGIELFALCDKKETKIDTPGRRQVQNEMFNERFDERAKRYLEQVRRSAMIEYR